MSIKKTVCVTWTIFYVSTFLILLDKRGVIESALGALTVMMTPIVFYGFLRVLFAKKNE